MGICGYLGAIIKLPGTHMTLVLIGKDLALED